MSGEVKTCNFSSILNDKRIKTKKRKSVEDKIVRLVVGGHEKLQLVVDFDYTLTRSHRNGSPVACSWGVLHDYKDCPQEYLDTVHALEDKYVPIELDPNLTKEQKIPHMIQWYSQVNKALQKSGVNKDWFEKMVRESNCELRDDTSALFSLLATHLVPVLVLSAGCGDLVRVIMSHFQVLHNNVEIVSNFLQFDHEGNIVGLEPPVIHMYNKSSNAAKQSDFFGKNKHRDNVILMGDSLGDLNMAEGVEDANVVLKIGFLNKKIEERLEQYLDHFDVVLVDDQTMDFPNAIIKDILGVK